MIKRRAFLSLATIGPMTLLLPRMLLPDGGERLQKLKEISLHIARAHWTYPVERLSVNAAYYYGTWLWVESVRNGHEMIKRPEGNWPSYYHRGWGHG